MNIAPPSAERRGVEKLDEEATVKTKMAVKSHARNAATALTGQGCLPTHTKIPPAAKVKKSDPDPVSGLLRFRCESQAELNSTAIFDAALERLQSIFRSYPYKKGSEIPPAITEVLPKFLRESVSYFKTIGVKTELRDGVLVIKPSAKTALGRYAARVLKFAHATIVFDPLMQWRDPAIAAEFLPKSKTINISINAARCGEPGIDELHEFIHALFAHYCGHFGVVSPFHGHIFAEEGGELFPERPNGYNKDFSLEENVTYAFATWYRSRNLKGLCDQLRQDPTAATTASIKTLQKLFQKLEPCERKGIGYEISQKSFALGLQFEKLLKTHLEKKSAVAYDKSDCAYLYYPEGKGEVPLTFELRANRPVLFATCIDRETNTRIRLQINDVEVVRTVATILAGANRAEAGRLLNEIAEKHLLPRMAATTKATHNLCKVYEEFQAAAKKALPLVKSLSEQTLKNPAQRTQFFSALDELFIASRALRRAALLPMWEQMLKQVDEKSAKADSQPLSPAAG